MASARPQSPWERLPEVEITAHGPFAVGSVLWRDGRGKLMCTVVAKATYELGPGESTVADVPLPLQEEDVHWDDEPSRSVHAPSDLAPFKSAAEVVVVGSAFAPGERPARSVVARVLVASVDKALECFPPRRFRLDGTVDDASPIVRFSLRYEHAARAPDNPAGIDLGRGDVRGRLPIPPLLPPGFALGAPGDHIPVAGFGPIASTWPTRGEGLGPHERAWILRPAASPMPEALPARHYQAAPMDQWLDRPLAANERIVLENLHAKHPRLVMSLAGAEPRAVIVSGRARVETLRLTGDLLAIDTDRKLCTLTFRGAFPVTDGAARLRVVVTGVPIGTELSPDGAREILESVGAGDEDLDEQLPEAKGDMGQTSQLPSNWVFKRPALPFAHQTQPGVPVPRGRRADGALPFHGSNPPREQPATPPPATEPPLVQPPAPMPLVHLPVQPPAPMPLVQAPAPMLVVQPAQPAPPAPVALAPPAVRAPPLMALGSTPPAEPRVSMPTSFEPAPSSPKASAGAPAGKGASSFDAAFGGGKPSGKSSGFDAAFGGGKSSGKSSSVDAGFGGVRAASDAAADKDRPRETTMSSATSEGPEPARRLWIVDLLCTDARLGPRLRGLKRFAGVFAAQAPPKRTPQSIDEPRVEPSGPDRDRADVLRVLSYARPEALAAVRRALAESLEEIVDLEPPVVVVAGELRPTFDEIDTLKLTVAVAQPVAGNDKKILAAISVAQEAIAAPIAPRADATLGLARQIEQATAALSLPPRYVAMEVERLLLEGRKYRRRPLLGEPRVRADLALGGGDAMTVYLPDTVTSALPLMAAFPVVAICAVRPREDIVEAQEDALFVMALGRVLQARGEAPG